MKVTKKVFDKLTELSTSHLNDYGQEVNNPRPLFLDTGLKHPPSLHDRVRALLRGELSQQAITQGHESFDEANDFDVKDDFDVEPTSNYELLDEEYLFVSPKNDSTERIEPDSGSTEPSDPSKKSGAEEKPESDIAD